MKYGAIFVFFTGIAAAAVSSSKSSAENGEGISNSVTALANSILYTTSIHLFERLSQLEGKLKQILKN